MALDTVTIVERPELGPITGTVTIEAIAERTTQVLDPPNMELPTPFVVLSGPFSTLILAMASPCLMGGDTTTRIPAASVSRGVMLDQTSAYVHLELCCCQNATMGARRGRP